MTALSADPVLAHLDADRDAALERLFAFLRIPSVSTDPAYADHCRTAAHWLADQLTEIGFDAAVKPTAGQPVVLAHHDGPADAPHLLFYGHYDVQPPEPLDLWDSPPFEPQLVDAERGKRIVARGAVDDKGQVMTIVEALRAWKAVHGALPIRATVLIEGEEECGSPSIGAFLEDNREALAADAVYVCDTGMWDFETPAITTMMRGMVYVQIDLTGPSRDLHSGMYGGAAANPLNVLTRILGDLRDETGRIRIPGFYDDVVDLPPEQKAQWEALGFDGAALLGDVGLSVPAGESDRSVLEQVTSRPTADINGLWGGYTGAGTKTVIPAEAHAKLSCRLVANQDAQKVLEGIKRFVTDRLPADCSVSFQVFGASNALHVPADSPFVQAAAAGLEAVFGRPAALIGSGGSIPILTKMQALLGLQSLLVGYGLDDDRVHSPNEKFELACFQRGTRANALILGRIGALGGQGRRNAA